MTMNDTSTTVQLLASDEPHNLIIPVITAIVPTCILVVIILCTCTIAALIILHVRRRRQRTLTLLDESIRRSYEELIYMYPTTSSKLQEYGITEHQKCSETSNTSESDITAIETYPLVGNSDTSTNHTYGELEKPPPLILERSQAKAKQTSDGVYFFYQHSLECNDTGLEHTIDGHNITIRIPEGAVSQGKSLLMKVGVTLFGPFSFPENFLPISPILQLCPSETQTDYAFRKPITVILPHFVSKDIIEKSNPGEICFAKAKHHNTGPVSYEFELIDTAPNFASSGSRNFGILEIQHCCYICLTKQKNLAGDEYYLVQIERPLQQRSEVYFLVIYYLDTCLRAVKEQYPPNEGYVYNIRSFKFKSGHLTMSTSNRHRAYTIALDPNPPKIWQSDVDIWKSCDDVKSMEEKHKNRVYPPRIIMTVAESNNSGPTFTLNVKFSGSSRPKQLNRGIMFPLVVKDTPNLSNSRAGAESRRVLTSKNPSLREAFDELFPLAHEWRGIGIFLNLNMDTIDRIMHEQQSTKDKLLTMLSERKRLAAPLTWNDIINAVEHYDEGKSEEIRQRIPK